MKIAVFWDVAPRCLEDNDRCFRGTYCFQHIALMMEAVSSSETLVNIYQTTRRKSHKTAIL
jgi:hypothetical protein